VFGNGIRFPQQWPDQARPRRIKSPGQRRRLRHAPWVLVAAVLVAAAAIGGFGPDRRAGSVVAWLSDPGSVAAPARDLVLRPSAAGAGPNLVVLRPAAAAKGVFALCAEGRRLDCVVDGDTIWHGGVKIRLADIDTPEIFSPQCASEAELGRRATERLLELVNAGPFEVVPIGARDADRYGRKLRILERSGRSLGDILIAEGLARPWDGARRSWCG
jgi:micrococcal nuclease